MRYRVVDVFTQQALEGNALAVFLDADALDSDTMQRMARETNLSETVFVLPATQAGCAARIRIFTPARELAFAGHPTVGSAWVLLDEGLARVEDGAGAFLLEELVGPVPVRVERGEGGRPLIWLSTPPIAFGRRFEARACAEATGLRPGDLLGPEPQMVSAGNPAIFVAVREREAVDRAFLEMQGLRRIRGASVEGTEEAGGACVFVFTPTAEGAYARMFAPELGIVEDPATGSVTGPLAAYMLRHGLVGERKEFVSEQGTKMGRRSLLHIRIAEDGGIEVGGYVTPVAEGRWTVSESREEGAGVTTER